MYGVKIESNQKKLLKKQIFAIFKNFKKYPFNLTEQIIFKPKGGELYLTQKNSSLFDGYRYETTNEVIDGVLNAKIQKADKITRIYITTKTNYIAIVHYIGNVSMRDEKSSHWIDICLKQDNTDLFWIETFRSQRKNEFEDYKIDKKFLRDLYEKTKNNMNI